MKEEITTVADCMSNLLFTNPVSDFYFPPERNLLHPFLLKVIFKVMTSQLLLTVNTSASCREMLIDARL